MISRNINRWLFPMIPLCVWTIRPSPVALLAHVKLVSVWIFSMFFQSEPRAPGELKSLWQGCSHFPLIWNEVYPAPDELNFLCQKPAISKKIMNNARRIPFQISLWGRGSNCREIKFPSLSLSTSYSAAADNVVMLVQFDAQFPSRGQSHHLMLTKTTTEIIQ